MALSKPGLVPQILIGVVLGAATDEPSGSAFS